MRPQIVLASVDKPVFNVQTLNKSLSTPNVSVRPNVIMPNPSMNFSKTTPINLNQSSVSNTVRFNKPQSKNNRSPVQMV